MNRLRVEPEVSTNWSASTYCRWRDEKLANYPRDAADLQVEIRDPFLLSPGERDALIDRCRRANLVIYQCKHVADTGKRMVTALAGQLGLHHLVSNMHADDDGISSVCVRDLTEDKEYVPYTNRPLNWHTDGYYNESNQPIRAFLMHCVQPAPRGGENGFLDPDIAYIMLRDENPVWIDALMQPDAMTIPANVTGDLVIRPSCQGPVFALDSDTGCLTMRYTSRRHHISWKEDENIRQAVTFLESILSNDSPWTIEHRLEAGEGIICNNILHYRAGFEEDSVRGRTRLLYRARYRDRIAGTSGDWNRPS